MNTIHSTRIAAALRRIGWGLLFELIDIRIGYFDILPDFIGYILLASGLSALGALHPPFRRARWAALAMIPLTLPHVLMESTVNLSNMAAVPIMLHGYVQLLLALHVLLAYWCFDGMLLMARQAGDRQLADTISLRMRFYMAVNVAQLIVYPFVLNFSERMLAIFIIFSLAGLLMELLFLRLPFRLAKLEQRRSREH